MTTMEALEVKNALLTLSNVTGMPASDITHFIMLFKPTSKPQLMEAQDLWDAFDNVDLVERARLVGIKITEV